MRLELIFGIHRTTHRIGLYIARHTADLSQAEAHILCHLAESDKATIAELHRAFAHRRSTLTSVLDRLAGRGLITRETSEKDRRSFVVSLTRSGKSKAAKVHRILEKLEDVALRGADRKSLKAFAKILARVEESASEDRAGR